MNSLVSSFEDDPFTLRPAKTPSPHFVIEDQRTGRAWLVNLLCCVCSKREDETRRIVEPQWMRQILLKETDPLEKRLAKCPTCRSILAFHSEKVAPPFYTWQPKERREPDE